MPRIQLEEEETCFPITRASAYDYTERMLAIIRIEGINAAILLSYV